MSGEGVHVCTFLWLSCVSVCAGLACRGAGGAGGTCSRGVCKGRARSEQVLRLRTLAGVCKLYSWVAPGPLVGCAAHFASSVIVGDPSWELARASG